MAFAPVTIGGIRKYRHFTPGEIIHVAGDPGVTFTRNKIYSIVSTAGVGTLVTDSLANGFLRCAKTTVCPAAATAFTQADRMMEFLDGQNNLDLIPMEPMLGECDIYEADIVNYSDETVVTYTASTRTIVETTGHGANDRANGALVLVYAGTGKGEINIVEDYVHASLALITHRAWNATLDTTSKLVVLAGTAGANNVGPGSTMDPYDGDSLDVIDGYDDGDWMVYPSWRDIAALLPLGRLPVIRRLNHE